LGKARTERILDTIETDSIGGAGSSLGGGEDENQG
jgi:hypothetical protein